MDVGSIQLAPDGKRYRLSDPGGDAPLRWEPMIEPKDVTLSGAAKAVGSGLLHEGFPALFGMPGDVRDLMNKGAAWAVNKAKGTADTPEAVTPEQISQAAASVGGPFAAVQKYAPTSQQIKENVSNKIAPDYEPGNFLERGLKATGGFAPSAVMAPLGAGNA